MELRKRLQGLPISANGLRLIGTLVILGLIFLKLDFSALHSVSQQLKWKLIVFPLTFLAVQMVIGMVRWWVVLRDRGIPLPWHEIAAYYLAAIAAGLLLPTQLGGESVRVLHLYKGRRAGVDAFSTVIYERSVGLGTLTLIGAIAALSVIGQVDLRVIALAVGMFTAAAMGIYLAVFDGTARRLLAGAAKRWRRRFLSRLLSLLDSLGQFRSGRLLAKTFGLSILYQSTNVFLVYFNSKVLGLDLPLRYFLVLVPLIGVLVMLPISIAGLGLREYLYITFFGSVGLPAVASFSLAILLFLETLLLALPGAVFLLRPTRGRVAEVAAVPVTSHSGRDTS